MPKEVKKQSVDFEKIIMDKVKSSEISMKPRWHFILGSTLMIIGLVGSSISAVFLTNLTLFLLRKHGPMGPWRFQQILESFPLWVPFFAVGGVLMGVWMLRKYDFSYKKNFWLALTGFVVAIFIAAFTLDYLGLNDAWSRQGPMRRFYQQVINENGHNHYSQNK